MGNSAELKTLGHYIKICSLIYGPTSGATMFFKDLIGKDRNGYEITEETPIGPFSNEDLNKLHKPPVEIPKIFIGATYHLNAYKAVKYHVEDGPIEFSFDCEHGQSALSYAKIWSEREGIPLDEDAKRGICGIGGKPQPIRRRE